MSTLALLKATAYSLRYRLTSDGADVTRTQAQLIADAQTYLTLLNGGTGVGVSDIKKLMTGNPDSQVTPSPAWTAGEWAALTSRKDFQIYVTARSTAAGAMLGAVSPGVNGLTVLPCGLTGEADIELRFIHSIVQ